MYHNYDKYVSYGTPVGRKNIILVFLKLLDTNRVEMEKLESIKTTLKFRIDREQGAPGSRSWAGHGPVPPHHLDPGPGPDPAGGPDLGRTPVNAFPV